jgi:hypothetical protein
LSFLAFDLLLARNVAVHFPRAGREHGVDFVAWFFEQRVNVAGDLFQRLHQAQAFVLKPAPVVVQVFFEIADLRELVRVRSCCVSVSTLRFSSRKRPPAWSLFRASRAALTYRTDGQK